MLRVVENVARCRVVEDDLVPVRPPRPISSTRECDLIVLGVVVADEPEGKRACFEVVLVECSQ